MQVFGAVTEAAVVALAFNPSTGMERQADLCELQDTQGCDTEKPGFETTKQNKTLTEDTWES